VDYTCSLDGPEEYWLQNVSARMGGASDISGMAKERDASTVEYFDHSQADFGEALTSNNGGGRSGGKSINATEREFYDGASAMFSNVDGLARSQLTLHGTGAGGERFGTEIEQMERRSADFGDVSQGLYDKSQADFCPKVDQDGHSDESSEGIVANHDPFNGIQEAIQDANRKSKPDSSEDQDASPEEDNRPSGRTRRIKQVLYSDKSESSVDDMMEDTPSNYNIANGRLEGKSMGLKAILLYAKKQGINVGETNTLHPIDRLLHT